MKLEILENEKHKALKQGDKVRNTVIGEMIDAIQKASMAGKTRVEITDELVDEALLKVQKTYQEMIDTCPNERANLRATYQTQLDIVNEFAPKLETDEGFIRARIQGEVFSTGMAFTKKNRGAIMKLIVPIFKGKADMKIVSKVLEGMLDE